MSSVSCRYLRITNEVNDILDYSQVETVFPQLKLISYYIYPSWQLEWMSLSSWGNNGAIFPKMANSWDWAVLGRLINPVR